MHRLLRPLLSVACALLCAGCAGAQYYAQSIGGQLEILARRRPIEAVLADPTAPEQLRARLDTVRRIVAFAHERLLLPDNGSYSSYAELGREYVAWNVFAAPELALEPLRWCFPVAGCLAYRGYFDRDRARHFAEALGARGLDVYLAPVAAYSTLGWFRDPVLDGMLNRSDAELARLLFHELAHQRLYLDGDTELNEAFADAVALIGVQAWLEHNAAASYGRFLEELAAEQAFVELVLAYRGLLQRLYDSELDAADRRAHKQLLLAALRADFATLVARDAAASAFAGWFARDLNNARLAALSTYRALVPLILDLYRAADSDLALFYARMEALQSCDRHARIDWLRRGEPRADC